MQKCKQNAEAKIAKNIAFFMDFQRYPIILGCFASNAAKKYLVRYILTEKGSILRGRVGCASINVDETTVLVPPVR